MALVLKKLVTRSTSVVTPYLRGSTNYPNPYNAASRSFLRTPFEKRMGRIFFRWMFNNSIPYTNCYTVKITSKGEEGVTIDMDENNNMIIIDDHLQTFVNIPGIEKTTETDEEIRVLLDLAMKDIDHNKIKVKLKKKSNAVIIDGYVQKDDVRKYCNARIELPLPPREICETIKAEMNDSVLVITIPKVVKKGPLQRLLTWYYS